jgi:hypothetical protein
MQVGLSEEEEGLGGQGKRQGRQIRSSPTRAAREVHVRVPVPVPRALWSTRFVAKFQFYDSIKPERAPTQQCKSG